MQTIGAQLKSAREAKGFSLDDVHRQTKIHKKVLMAIEEDRTDAVLNPTYIKGFLKKYATFLGLDGNAITEEFTSLHTQAPQQVLMIETEDEKAEKESFRKWTVPLIVASIAVVGLAFIIYLSLDLLNIINKKPTNGTTVKSEVTTVASKPKPIDYDKPAIPPVPRSEKLKLTIKANEDSWMQVKSDTEVIYQNILKKGSAETWVANDSIDLWVGNARGLDLDLNGRKLGSPGQGVIKDIRITRGGLKIEK